MNRNRISSLDYDDTIFSVSKKYYGRIKRIIIFADKNGLAYSVHASDEKFEDSTNLLLVKGENKSYYVNIKDFNRFMCHKTKYKNKK